MTKKMKKTRHIRQRLWFDVFVGLSACALVIFGISNRLNSHANSIDCPDGGTVHSISLIDDSFVPNHVQMPRCDTLKISNTGPSEYSVAFGTHDQHIDYSGFTMQTLGPEEFLEIKATQVGRFTVHDHLRDRAHLSLDVTPK